MRVLVAGDIVTDHYIYEGQQRPPGSTVLEGAKWFSELGGAGLVGNLLRTIANSGSLGASRPFDVVFGFADRKLSYASTVADPLQA